MQKWIELAYALSALLGAVSVAAGVLANVLPEGKAKTAASYVGLRLGKAYQIAKGALPAKDGAK